MSIDQLFPKEAHWRRKQTGKRLPGKGAQSGVRSESECLFSHWLSLWPWMSYSTTLHFLAVDKKGSWWWQQQGTAEEQWRWHLPCGHCSELWVWHLCALVYFIDDQFLSICSSNCLNFRSPTPVERKYECLLGTYKTSACPHLCHQLTVWPWSYISPGC